MYYKRMPIEKESPEEIGYDSIECNLAESSVTDLILNEIQFSLKNLKLEYTAHRGNETLRELIADGTPGISGKDVLLTNGAAAALFIVNTALLDKGDHMVVIRPNYATNLSVPQTIGCNISYIDLEFEKNWQIEWSQLYKALTPATKLISVTTPHNPTGMVIREELLQRLVEVTETHDLYLLVDETYRDTCFKTQYPVVAAAGKKVISVSSLSKAYGLPGLRIGWIITRNETLMEQFLAAKEMIYITNSVADEAIAHQFLLQKEQFSSSINARALKNFEVLKQWLGNEKRMEAVLPEGGVVCFPRFKKPVPVETGKFYSTLMRTYKTMVGPGHWFDMPDTYMRIGFGWTDASVLQQGLTNISRAIDECLLP